MSDYVEEIYFVILLDDFNHLMNKERCVTHEEHQQSHEDIVGGPEVRHVKGELFCNTTFLSSRLLSDKNSIPIVSS